MCHVLIKTLNKLLSYIKLWNISNQTCFQEEYTHYYLETNLWWPSIPSHLGIWTTRFKNCCFHNNQGHDFLLIFQKSYYFTKVSMSKLCLLNANLAEDAAFWVTSTLIVHV